MKRLSVKPLSIKQPFVKQWAAGKAEKNREIERLMARISCILSSHDRGMIFRYFSKYRLTVCFKPL
jgi:hypothetical protein